VLIAYGLRRNSTVIDVNLNMNPIGRNGCQALLRHQVLYSCTHATALIVCARNFCS
jgi:hypothetical protein